MESVHSAFTFIPSNRINAHEDWIPTWLNFPVKLVIRDEILDSAYLQATSTPSLSPSYPVVNLELLSLS